MIKGQNYNHPKKGSTIRVQPITSKNDIIRMKKYLEPNPRDYALFVVGINTNLRASDLIRITAGQVRDLKPMEELTLKEKKTGKMRRINLNEACVNAIQRLLHYYQEPFSDDEPIFNLTVPSVSRLVKSWCSDLGLKGNYASHSLRKSWGFFQHKFFKVPLPELMVCFNHATQEETLNYLGIQPETVRQIYANQI